VTIAEVFFAAGAKRVLLTTHRFITLESPKDVHRIDSAVRSSKEATIGSAHPQGENPSSSDPALGAVDEHLRVHGFDNPFVCDASVIPSCIGVHPTFTIMALAKHTAGSFADWMRAQGKHGGQNKVPRVPLDPDRRARLEGA